MTIYSNASMTFTLSFLFRPSLLPPGPTCFNIKPHFMTSRMFRVCILATAWIILGSAAPTHHKTPVVKEASYYWFWADSDMYVEYCTTTVACSDFGDWTGHLVNTQQAGGTLVANGYLISTQPHSGWPQVQLYSH